MSISKAEFIWGIREQESHGNYSDTNPSGATGAYQVLASNIAGWTKKVLGHSVSRETFLKSPAIQDAVADKILGDYYTRFGPESAAAMWYSGQPVPTATWGDPPVYKYVQEVMDHARKAPSGISLPLSGSKAATKGTDTGTPSTGSSSDSTGGILSWPGDIVGFFKDATDSVTSAAEFFTAFFRPSTYVRIAAGWFGFMLIIAGIVALGMSAAKES